MEGQGRKTIRLAYVSASLCLAGFILMNSASSVPRGGASFSRFDRVQPGSNSIDTSSLEEGDILLRRGRGFVSSMIAGVSSHGVSHCGIVLKDGDNWMVVHSISGHISDRDGIRANTLPEFIQDALPGTLYHLKPRFEIDRRTIANLCGELLHRKIGFDHNFNLEDESELYCSELIRCVYLRSGMPDRFSYSFPGGKKVIDMGSFFDPELFKIQKRLD